MLHYSLIIGVVCVGVAGCGGNGLLFFLLSFSFDIYISSHVRGGWGHFHIGLESRSIFGGCFELVWRLHQQEVAGFIIIFRSFRHHHYHHSQDHTHPAIRYDFEILTHSQFVQNTHTHTHTIKWKTTMSLRRRRDMWDMM